MGQVSHPRPVPVCCERVALARGRHLGGRKRHGRPGAGAVRGVRRSLTGPALEWRIVDVLENLERDDVFAQLSAALAAGRFNSEVLVDQTTRWATPLVYRTSNVPST